MTLSLIFKTKHVAVIMIVPTVFKSVIELIGIYPSILIWDEYMTESKS